MSKKFKIGDEVKVRKLYRMQPDHKRGVVVRDRGEDACSVRFPEAERPDSDSSPEQGWLYYEHELKAVKHEATIDSEVVDNYPTLDEVVAKVEAAEKSIILELTERQAEVLYHLTGHVGGDPEGPRGAISHIRYALSGLDVTAPPLCVTGGTIYYQNHWPDSAS